MVDYGAMTELDHVAVGRLMVMKYELVVLALVQVTEYKVAVMVAVVVAAVVVVVAVIAVDLVVVVVVAAVAVVVGRQRVVGYRQVAQGHKLFPHALYPSPLLFVCGH